MICPAGVMRPISVARLSANQRLPSGPAVIPEGSGRSWLRGNSVICPAGVMRPILARTVLGKPEVAIGPHGNGIGVTLRGSRAERKPSDRPLGSDAANLVPGGIILGKPEVTIRPSCNPL